MPTTHMNSSCWEQLAGKVLGKDAVPCVGAVLISVETEFRYCGGLVSINCVTGFDIVNERWRQGVMVGTTSGTKTQLCDDPLLGGGQPRLSKLLQSIRCQQATSERTDSK